MTLVNCPAFATVEDAIDWFEERGVEMPVLWAAPDGRVRGSGARRGEFESCAFCYRPPGQCTCKRST